MATKEQEEKVVEDAITILKSPDNFCKSYWFMPKDDKTQEGDIVRTIDPTYREGYKELQRHLETNGATIANPNYRVCGQGAIYVSAAIHGLDFDEALEVVDNIEVHVGGIPGFNDSEKGTAKSVREMIAIGWDAVIKAELTRK